MNPHPFRPIALVLTLLLTLAASAQTKRATPLSIARQGYLFAGGKYSDVNDKKLIYGQMYVEFQIPSKMTHPYPIVMVHGGRQSGSNFTGTPDGREGWAQFFLRSVYRACVDIYAARVRSSYESEVCGPQS